MSLETSLLIFTIGLLSCVALASVIVIVGEYKYQKAERLRLRAEQDKKYENEVMYDGEALTWLDKRLNRLRDNIQTTTYNEVKKSGRKLVKIADFNRILKRFIKR
jgi:hypothetical protein